MHRGMTVEHLARDANVARSTLREILTGRSNPRFSTLGDIARALGLKSVLELLQKV